MGLVSAFRQSIYLSKHNGLTLTQIAQEWPAAVELQPLECETPRIVAALSRRMRKQLIIMLVLKIVFYAADLANPWLVGLVSLEYVEPSKYYALITATFLGCRFVMFSCQGLGDMTARLCGVAAMSSMTRWVFDRMMVLPLGIVNPGLITNLCVTEARAVSMGLNAVVYTFFFPMRIGVCWLMQLFVVGPRAWLITAALQVLQVLLVQRWLRKRIQRVIVRKNQASDVRVKCVEQAVDEMKIIKFLGAESSREAQLAACRAREARLDGLVVIMNQSSAVIGFALAILNPVLGLFLKYQLTGTPWSLWLGLTYWGLNTQSISLIGQLHDKLPFVSNAMAALKRYRTFGELPTRPSTQIKSYQVDPESFTQDDRPDSSLRLFGSEYSFHSATGPPKPVLWDPKLVVTPGQTCLVIGPTGCGKSSLLLALLGELAHGGGHDVTSKGIHGAVCGYTSQQVVLFAQSIRENIVSGRAFRTEEYKAALSASCLVRDLEQIAGEDSAQIAAGGGSLSGGQQMRVALARSFYALFSAPATSHRMLLADDPMAALDAKVSAAVFESGFMQSLHGSTQVIALGMLAYLDHPAVDTILFMQQGKIAFRGSISELLEASSKSSFSDSWLSNALAHSNIDTQAQEFIRRLRPRVAHTLPLNSMNSFTKGSFNTKRGRRAAILSESLVTHGEKSQTGKVDSATVKRVVKIAGRWFFVVLVCHFTCQNLLRMYFSWEMTAYIALEQRDPSFGTLPLVGIVAIMVTTQIVYSFILANRGQRIITQLLKLAFNRVMHCPLPVLQSKSKGEITSRLIEVVAALKRVLETVQGFLNALFGLGISLMYTVPVLPYTLFGAAATSVFCWRLGRAVVPTSRDLARCNQQSKTPVHSVLAECMKGSVTVRALRAEEEARRRFSKAVQLSTTCAQANILMTEMVGMILSIYAWAYVAIIVIVMWQAPVRNYVVALPGLGPTGFAFVVNGMSNLSMQIKGLLQGYIPIESGLVAAQRVTEYIDKLEQEKPHEMPGDEHLGVWPSHGKLEVFEVSLRYLPSLPLALKCASFHVPSGSSLGIVGRSGAGKSTIISALLRLVECESGGAVHIDGVDISTVGLRRLRESVAIVPQEPILLAGTLRSNLDASNKHTDEALWRLLDVLELKGTVRAVPGALNASTDSLSLSLGQCQLLCMARALLRQTAILLMDEATSALDSHSEHLVEVALAESGAGKQTRLAIAHHLHTIFAYDRVLVLDGGEVAEFGPPSALVASRGVFAALAAAQTSGDIDAASEAVALARKRAIRK